MEDDSYVFVLGLVLEMEFWVEAVEVVVLVAVFVHLVVVAVVVVQAVTAEVVVVGIFYQQGLYWVEYTPDCHVLHLEILLFQNWASFEVLCCYSIMMMMDYCHYELFR